MNENTQTQLQEEMKPAELAEWLAVHELDSETTVFNQDAVLDGRDPESYPWDLVTEERVRGLGYLASLHNNRAETELEELVTTGPNHFIQTAEAALILAEVNDDPKWLTKALELSDAVATRGLYDGHKYRMGANSDAEAIRKKAATIAVKLGFTDELKEEVSGWSNEKSSDLMSGYINAAENNGIAENDITLPTVDETTQARINEILDTLKDGDVDKSLNSVDALPSKTARLVAYQAIADAMRS